MHKIKSVYRIYWRILPAAQVFLIYSWLTNLQGTDSYYSVYLLCAFAGLLALLDNQRRNVTVEREECVWLGGFSILFSLAVMLANYSLFEIMPEVRNLYRLINAAVTLLGGSTAMWHILLWLLRNSPRNTVDVNRDHGVRFFVLVFLTITAIDLLYLFTSAYPGIMSRDTFGSIGEIMSGCYGNLNPFWYTITIELFYKIGNAVFGEINAAFGFVTSCFVIFMAACIAYSLMTLYEVKVPKFAIACVYFVNVMLPHYTQYSEEALH